MSKVAVDDLLNKAYRLAYFIHPDKGTAVKVVTAAMLKLDVAMAVQSKRLYYVPVGRFLPNESRRTDGFRNKALLCNLHLLQRLIYIESEPYEREKERAVNPEAQNLYSAGGTLRQEDLIIYFIKHLVRITIKRNAFYATLGISRLLHNYSTVETMEIYNAVIGEPERVKDDYYYRSRKGVLMQEMKQRFGSLLGVCRRRRGEERFEAEHASSKFYSLVKECLRSFTPWNTRCAVPADFNPLTTVITCLTSRSNVDENEVEADRLHAVFHPDCFERLVAGLGYDVPERRLEVPRFFFEKVDDQKPPQQRRPPGDLSAEELSEIKDILDEQAGRRRSPAVVMRIMVDGVERATLDPAERSTLRLSIKEDAELIEIRTTEKNGALLLATHLLTDHEDSQRDGSITSSILLEAGQKLSLTVARRQNAATGAASLLIDFKYKETDPVRAIQLFSRRLSFRLFPPRRSADQQSIWSPKVSARQVFAFACCLLAICATGYLAYLRLRPRPAEQMSRSGGTRIDLPSAQNSFNPGIKDRREETRSRATETPLPPSDVTDRNRPAAATKGNEGTSKALIPPPARRRQESRKSTPEETTAASKPSGGESNQPESAGRESAFDLTRGNGIKAPGLSLGEVQKVYLALPPDGPLNQELRRSLVQNLGSTRLITVVANGDEADAALKVTAVQNPTRKMPGEAENQVAAGPPQRMETDEAYLEVVVRLVNARGEALWPRPKGGASGHYAGAVTKICAEMVNDLLAEIKAARAIQSQRR